MTVNVRFVCNEVVGDARPGAYTLPDGATIADLMKQAADENGSFVDGYMDHLIFLINSRPATAGDMLHDGDRLNVLRMIFGG